MTALAMVGCAIPDTLPVLEEGDAFRLAMRDLASGVSLITHGVGDQRTGLTATSVASLSTDPPTIACKIARPRSIRNWRSAIVLASAYSAPGRRSTQTYSRGARVSKAQSAFGTGVG